VVMDGDIRMWTQWRLRRRVGMSMGHEQGWIWMETMKLKISVIVLDDYWKITVYMLPLSVSRSLKQQ
jgi:hypothetical protein